jgi:hypothetical protein
MLKPGMIFVFHRSFTPMVFIILSIKQCPEHYELKILRYLNNVISVFTHEILYYQFKDVKDYESYWGWILVC